MKRIWLVGIVMILAFAAVSCDSAWAPVEEPIEYTEDGRPLINMSINLNNNRAMTNALAKAAHDYYEVVFDDTGSTDYYRTAWFKDKVGKIKLPAGTYEAILFAGVENGKILLATGSTATITVDATTNTISFTMTPLNTNVNETTATSTFKILTPTPSPTPTIPTAQYETSLEDTINVPVFAIGENTAATATMDITIVNGTKIVVAGTARFGSIGLFSDRGHKPVEIAVAATFNPPDPTNPTLDDGLNTISLDLTPPATGITTGFTKIFFSIPVKAFDDDPAVPGFTWNIQGGLANLQLDDGADENSTGGAIVLAVGTGVSGVITLSPDPFPAP